MAKFKQSLRQKIAQIFQIYNTDTYATEELAKTKYNLLSKMTLIIIIASAAMTVINILMDSVIMGYSTAVIAVLSIILYFILKKWHNTYIPENVYGVILLVIFTYYFIIGGNEGFAALWIVLVPLIVLHLFNFKMALVTCLYFLVFVSCFCWIKPLHAYIYAYNTNFLNRFPVLYMLSLALAFRVEYQVKKAAVQQMNNLAVLDAAVKEERRKNYELSLKVLSAIENIEEARDPYTSEHSLRVATFATKIAKRAGMDDSTCKTIYAAGLVHDIGKIGVPDAVLLKNGSLTDSEYAKIQSHPKIGYDIVKNYDIIDGLVEGTLYHHEHFDGTGYPNKLKGDEIPEIARIIAVADTFDAMYSTRVYREKRSIDYVVSEVKNAMGTQLDPKFAKILLELIAEGEILKEQ